MKKILLICLILQTTFLQIIAQDWQNKVDIRLHHFDGTNEKIEFLVQFTNQTNVLNTSVYRDKTAKGAFVMQQLQTNAIATQQNVIDILKNKDAPFQEFWIANVIWAYGDFELVKQIVQQAEVIKISENTRMPMLEPIKSSLENFDKSVEIPWGIKQMNVDDVWEKGYKGKGVVVGGQDTGYDWEHESLQSKYRGWDGINANHNYNWHDAIRTFDSKHDTMYNPCGLDIDFPCDDNRHGTHTMGTMVGETSNKKIGVAPEATWIGCRNMERGWGTPQSYLECFQWFLAPTDLNNENPDPSKAPHVINNSWGCPESEGCNPNNFTILEAAVNNLKAAGIVVIVSAGNSGSDCETISNPAAIFENSFTVGALNQNEVIASFSSRGLVTIDGSRRMKPNVVAPGVSVESAVLDNSYTTLSGTSMAGPHVAGLVALMISADPTLAGDVERIETIIEQSAIDRITTQTCEGADGSDIPNFVYGHGTVDALSAINTVLAEAPTSSEDRFNVYPNPTSNTVTFEFVGYDGKMELQIFVADGKQVINEVIDFNGGNKLRTIDLSSYANGVYYYRLCNESKEDCLDGRILKN